MQEEVQDRLHLRHLRIALLAPFAPDSEAHHLQGMIYRRKEAMRALMRLAHEEPKEALMRAPGELSEVRMLAPREEIVVPMRPGLKELGEAPQETVEEEEVIEAQTPRRALLDVEIEVQAPMEEEEAQADQRGAPRGEEEVLRAMDTETIVTIAIIVEMIVVMITMTFHLRRDQGPTKRTTTTDTVLNQNVPNLAHHHRPHMTVTTDRLQSPLLHPNQEERAVEA